MGKNIVIKKEVVDSRHRYWHAVYARLFPTYYEKDCDHSLDLVTAILYSLPNVDVEGTLDFYRENGGYCDCEVINNVYNEAPELQFSGY
jgi:hypothetical protein